MNKLLSTAAAALLLLSMGTPLRAEHGSLFGAELDHFLYFPHFGNGETIKSELVLLITGGEAHPLIHFTDHQGNPVSADSLVEITDTLMLDGDGGLTTVDPVPAGGEITISTNGAGEVVTGSVKVLSATSIEGFLRFTLPSGVAGVASARPNHNFIVPVQLQEGGINTGLAIHNLSDSLTRVNCTLRKDGQELESADIDEDLGLEDADMALAANSQVAQFIDELFPKYFATTPASTDTTPFTGSVRCGASSRVTAVALELDYLSGAVGVFTTLPVISWSSGAGFFSSP